MKIALVTQHFPPRFTGGTEAVVAAQARELAALGHDVCVVSGTDEPHRGEDVERDEHMGVPVAFVPRLPDEAYDLALARPRVLALVRAEVEGVELVHVHHHATLDARLARSLRGAHAVVVTQHDLFATCPRFFRIPIASVERCPTRGDVEPCVRCCAPDAPGLDPGVLRRGLVDRARGFEDELRAADVLVAPSGAHARALASLLGRAEAELEVVPHGLVGDPGGRLDAAWDGAGPLRVAHFGNRAEVKGTLDLVQALAGLPDPARVELLLAGSEVEPGFDARLVAAAGGVTLDFRPSFAAGGLADAVRGAHLAAFPSRARESYGLVVDEALALGLPVWVSDRGAPKERVGGAGRILPAAEPGAWRAAFAAVLESPESLASEAARVPKSLRTAREAARELDALYRRVVGARS